MRYDTNGCDLLCDTKTTLSDRMSDACRPEARVLLRAQIGAVRKEGRGSVDRAGCDMNHGYTARKYCSRGD